MSKAWGQNKHHFMPYLTQKNLNNFVRTSTLVVIYKLIEYYINCFGGQVGKLYKSHILSVADDWDKIMITLRLISHKKL